MKAHSSFSWHPHFQKQESSFLSFQAYQLTSFSTFTLALVFIKDQQEKNEAEKMLEAVKTLHLYHQDLTKRKKTNIYSLLRSIQDHVLEKYAYEDLPLFLLHANSKRRAYIFQLSSSFPCWHQRNKSITCLQDPSFIKRSTLRWKKLSLDDEADSPFFAFRCTLQQNDKLILTQPCVPVPNNKKQLQKFKSKLLDKEAPIIGTVTLTTAG